MMIEVELVDRQEIRHNAQWVCYEILTVICPNCGRPTNITVTYPMGTEYHHDGGEFCQVGWNREPVPLGFEFCVYLTHMNEVMRGV
jgi:hypothetical protein